MQRSQNPSRLRSWVLVVAVVCAVATCSIAQSQPAARVGDQHICPLVTGPVPHVGGPVLAPGIQTVLIGGAEAAVVGTLAQCVGPVDMIAVGESTVLIGGSPAARLGDGTVHGGSVVSGLASVLIGGSSKAGQQAAAPFAALEKQADFYSSFLSEHGEDEAVRNALATTYLLLASVYENSGDETSMRMAHERALQAIEPAAADAGEPYILVTYVHALVVNGRAGEAGPAVGELHRRGWNDPSFRRFLRAPRTTSQHQLIGPVDRCHVHQLHQD